MNRYNYNLASYLVGLLQPNRYISTNQLTVKDSFQEMEHFKAFSKHDHCFAIADHVRTNGCNIKWERFDILASGQQKMSSRSVI